MGNKDMDDRKISVTMISNAMNHHQFPFCDSMFGIDNITFRFIATKPISQERLNTGFSDLNCSREYIVRAYESDCEYKKAMKLADESDFVIYGSAPYEFIKKRKKSGKWIFIYSERLFKETRGGDLFNIKTFTACMLRYFFASHKNLRLLCSSAFSSNDFRIFRFKEEQAYKWGYFPPVSNLSIEKIFEKKEPASIVWVGRMIHWKHAELAVELAKMLKADNIDFNLKIIGDGPMVGSLKAMTAEADLEDCVCFMGVLSAENTRAEMENSCIMISTSDQNEGWGAVINEGMSSGCAVVASHLMGSVPFLIQDGENGRVFESGNVEDLFSKVKYLLENKSASEKLGKNAYYTISNDWNGETAAKRLAELMHHYINGKTSFSFEDGICSYAERLKNNWININ